MEVDGGYNSANNFTIIIAMATIIKIAELLHSHYSQVCFPIIVKPIRHIQAYDSRRLINKRRHGFP